MRAALEQVHVLDERLDGHVGAAHAFDELDARAILLAVVAHAAGGAAHVAHEADALVVAQGVGRDVVLLADFGDLHPYLHDI